MIPKNAQEDNEPISVLIEKFLLYMRYRRSATNSTIDTYRSTLMFFVEFTEDCPVSDLSVELVDNYANSLIAYNLKPKTYRNRLTPVRSFFKYLYIKNYTNIKPESIELPKEGVHEANFLDEEEQQRLISACENPRERALILFMLRSGLRVSEVIDAHYDDLYKRSVAIRVGKGQKPRVSFIDEEAELAIRQYHATIPPQTYLFPNAAGGRISRQYIARLISRIAEKANINKRVSCHTLRHTFATNLLRRGARAEDVQPMLGHKNIRTTLIYMHFTNEYLHSQYDKIMKNEAFV